MPCKIQFFHHDDKSPHDGLLAWHPLEEMKYSFEAQQISPLFVAFQSTLYLHPCQVKSDIYLPEVRSPEIEYEINRVSDTPVTFTARFRLRSASYDPTSR